MTRWTDDHKKRALQMRQQGHLFKEIAVYLGCTEKAVSHFFASQREALAQMPPPPNAPIVPPRTFVNSMMRKPLTDEKLRAMWVNYAPIVGGVLEFARAIERAHGIGEAK